MRRAVVIATHNLHIVLKYAYFITATNGLLRSSLAIAAGENIHISQECQRSPVNNDNADK